MPATKWMLEIGAVLLRTETELILKSRRVAPRRLVESGFTFDFPAWPAAADDLCRRWPEKRAGGAAWATKNTNSHKEGSHVEA